MILAPAQVFNYTKLFMFPFTSDADLKAHIDSIFKKYDKDKNGTLDRKELSKFLTDLYKVTGIDRKVTEKEASELIARVDVNSDGNMNKQEMWMAFRGVSKQQLNKNFQNPTQNYGQGNRGQPGGYGGGGYANQNQAGYRPNALSSPYGQDPNPQPQNPPNKSFGNDGNYQNRPPMPYNEIYGRPQPYGVPEAFHKNPHNFNTIGNRR